MKNKKILLTLKLVQDLTDKPQGMYPGWKWKDAPAQLNKLQNLGYVEKYIPHNPIHDTYAVITNTGRTALREV